MGFIENTARRHRREFESEQTVTASIELVCIGIKGDYDEQQNHFARIDCLSGIKDVDDIDEKTFIFSYWE